MLEADDKPRIHAEITAGFADARERLITRLEESGFWDGDQASPVPQNERPASGQ